MRVDAIGVALSRRSMSEASDLGVRLVAANARSVWATWLPVHAAVVAIAALGLVWQSWLAVLVLFWLKPWLDRTLLFALARAVFREPTRFGDVWRARRDVWWRDAPATLTLRRLVPWRSYAAPVQQLEGQSGPARRKRVRQVLAQGRGAAIGVTHAFVWVEAAIAMACFFLPGWFSLDRDADGWLGVLEGSGDAAGIRAFASYAVAVAIVEPFYVGAGFAMYLNRRVELEAWDIEQEFRVAFAT